MQAAPGYHDMLPQPTHDELARENLVRSLRHFLNEDLYPLNRAVYDSQVAPAYAKQHGHAPADPQEVKAAYFDHPFFRTVLAVYRTTQEMLWDDVGETVERQLPALIDRARGYRAATGTLRLDPDLEIPDYVRAVDIHVMPGNFQTEIATDDVFAGALYDRGVNAFAMSALGPYNESVANLTIDFIKAEFPELKPRRILDLGCTVGHSTLPYKAAFPDAEVHGLDVGAPMVRYAHARAEAMGVPAHFSQQDARHTDFPAGSFDLIVSHLLIHEMPQPSIKATLAECHRLLSAGGVMVHHDGFGLRKDPFDDFFNYWINVYNNEPFSRGSVTLDFKQAAAEAGFRDQDIFVGGRKPAYLKQFIGMTGLKGAVKGAL